MQIVAMWKLAQQSLSQGKLRRPVPLRYGFLSGITSKGNIEQSSRNHTTSPGSRKRQHQRHSKHKSINHENAKKFIESSRAFVEKSSSPDKDWTVEQLALANKILNTWSRQTIPTEMQSSWIPIAEKLLSTSLDQYQTIASIKQESTTALMPSSETFCSIITMYSKSNLPNAAERADYWLRKMIVTSKLHPDLVAYPRATIFANVLSAWEKSRLPGTESRAQRLWTHLTSTRGLTPTSSAYYLYISLWSKSDLPEASETAEKILREMLQNGKRNPQIVPSCPIFVNVISSWRRKKESGYTTAHRAQLVLDLLVKEYNRRLKLPQEWMRFSINDIPFNATIQAWTNSSLAPRLVEERVNHILKTMEQLEISPTMVTAWSTLPMYCFDEGLDQSKAIIDVPTKLLKLLDFSMSNEGGGKNPMIRNQIFAKSLEICSSFRGTISEGSITAGEAAEEILVNKYFKRPRGERRVETTVGGFEHAIKAWRYDNNHDREHKTQRIVELIKKLEKEVEHIYEHTHKKNPSAANLYASLAKVWVIGYYPNESLGRAEINIDHMLACFRDQPELKINPFCFLDIIEAANENLSSKIADDFVTKLYMKLLANDSQFYRLMNTFETSLLTGCDSSSVKQFLDGVLDTLAGSAEVDSGRRAESVLLKQQELYEAGISSQPTFDTFKKVLRCWSNSQDNSAPDRMENMLLLAQSLYDAGDTRLRPDFDGHLTVISAWSTSLNPDAPDKIQSHLKKLNERKMEGDQTFRIDSRVYAALIRAYANSGRDDVQIMTDAIFQSASDDLKDTKVYNALIEAQGGDSNRAEQLLQVMQLSYSEGNDIVKPNTETFNAVIQSWLRSGSPMAAWRVDGIFKRMEELSSSGKLHVKPNSRTFDLIISTLAQDWGAELAKVDIYLELLKEHYRAGDFLPTTTSYTEAIRAWASKDDDPRAILRAHALLEEMHELAREGVATVRPNRSTYEVYLEGLFQSSVENRTDLVSDVLFKMRENKFDIDHAMRSSIQRCLLPVGSRAHTWIIDVDDFVVPQNEWMHKTVDATSIQ